MERGSERAGDRAERAGVAYGTASLGPLQRAHDTHHLDHLGRTERRQLMEQPLGLACLVKQPPLTASWHRLTARPRLLPQIVSDLHPRTQRTWRGN